MYGNRVVVTGLGAISPIGLSADDYWNNLLAGVSGAAQISSFDASGLPVQIAAEVKGFDPGDYMDRKAARRMERFAQFSIAAAGQALADAGLEITDANAYDVGAIVATGLIGDWWPDRPLLAGLELVAAVLLVATSALVAVVLRALPAAGAAAPDVSAEQLAVAAA
jgi:hypothetical protein